VKRILKICAVTVLTAAALQALRIGCADYFARRATKHSLHRAIGLWPVEAGFYARLAVADPQNARAHLLRAVALNPRLSRSWIDLGLGYELEGARAEAERCYLSAARYDHQFLPAWTLANFYARVNEPDKFWPAARAAAEMSYDSITPLLRLAFGFTANPDQALDRMIVQRPRVERDFLYYLLGEHLDASGIVTRMVNKGDRENRDLVVAWANRLLETNRTADALQLWNTLSDKRLIPYSHAGLLTNADFAVQPLQGGFDWQIFVPPGVTCVREGGGLRIEFSGSQPEGFELALQYLLLSEPSYLLSYEYRTVEIKQTTNLRWRLGKAFSEPLVASEDWKQANWTFIPGGENRLALVERRDVGTVRPEGVVYLRGLKLAPSKGGS